MKEFVEQTINKALNHSFVRPNKYSFRPSGLPYCALRDALSKMQRTTQSLPLDSMLFKYEYAKEVGIVAHALIQRSMSELGSIFGNWECLKCSSLQEYTSRPNRCCGEIPKYQEIKLTLPEFPKFAALVDAIIELPDGGLIVLDFKTKDKRKVKPGMLENSHRLQVSSYYSLIRMNPVLSSRKIVAVGVVYICREEITKFQVEMVEIDEFMEMEFAKFQQDHRQAIQALQTGKLAELPRHCTTPRDEPYCPYNATVCFGSCTEAILEQEWQKYHTALTTTSHPGTPA